MQPGPDPLGAPPSFTARRPNASNLPNFELPPPPLAHLQKYPYATLNATQASPAPGSLASVGNLLTPPSNLHGDGLSPVSSGVASTQATSTQGIQQYAPHSYAWSPAPQNNPPYGFQSSNSQQQFGGHRGVFSPSLNKSDNLPPPYEMNSMSYQSSGSMSAPGTLPTMGSHHQPMSSAMMHSQTPVSTAPPQPSPVHTQQEFQRHPPTPSSYYSSQHSSTPQQQQNPFPYSSGPSPTQQTPLSAGGQMSRMSPPNSAGPVPSLPSAPSHSPYTHQRPFSSQYSLPGPVMSNISNPNGQMALVNGMPHGMIPGGYNSGHVASLQQIYAGHHAPQQPPTNDRPFKCDQCPQSFNRNHDLKRHKRIHLAVKPFPCGHCDKSFSRKDALKRHVLVKGCGKANASSGDKQDGSASPVDKGSMGSDSAENKPVHIRT